MSRSLKLRNFHAGLLAEQSLKVAPGNITSGQADMTPFSTVLDGDRAAHAGHKTMRINIRTKLLFVLGIIWVLASCTTGRPNHPSSATTRNPSSVSETRGPAQRQGLSNQDIRSVDFANFAFPWLHELGDPGKTFTLRSGERKPTYGRNGMVEEMGIRLQSIGYGDVTGDGGEEALVVISLVTGGSAIPHATYIYASEDGKPKSLWAFSTGDRADGGLRRVYAEKGELVIERYSPANSKGDCCPTLFTRARYKWQNKHFEQSGKEELFPNSEGHGSPLMEAYR